MLKLGHPPIRQPAVGQPHCDVNSDRVGGWGGSYRREDGVRLRLGEDQTVGWRCKPKTYMSQRCACIECVLCIWSQDTQNTHDKYLSIQQIWIIFKISNKIQILREY